MSRDPPVVDFALLECRVTEINPDHADCHIDLTLFDVEFFDDQSMIVLYKARGDDDGRPCYFNLTARLLNSIGL